MTESSCASKRLSDAAFDDLARSLVGTQFRHEGRSPVTGIDCVGLCALLLPEFDHFDRIGYADAPTIHEAQVALAGLARVAIPASAAAIRKRTLLVWRLARDTAHFSVAMGNGWHVHVLSYGAGVRREPIPTLRRLVVMYDTSGD